jgi:hypothetical protein
MGSTKNFGILILPSFLVSSYSTLQAILSFPSHIYVIFCTCFSKRNFYMIILVLILLLKLPWVGFCYLQPKDPKHHNKLHGVVSALIDLLHLLFNFLFTNIYLLLAELARLLWNSMLSTVFHSIFFLLFYQILTENSPSFLQLVENSLSWLILGQENSPTY